MVAHGGPRRAWGVPGPRAHASEGARSVPGACLGVPGPRARASGHAPGRPGACPALLRPGEGDDPASPQTSDQRSPGERVAGLTLVYLTMRPAHGRPRGSDMRSSADDATGDSRSARPGPGPDTTSRLALTTRALVRTAAEAPVGGRTAGRSRQNRGSVAGGGESAGGSDVLWPPPGHLAPGHMPPGHLPPGHLPPGHLPPQGQLPPLGSVAVPLHARATRRRLGPIAVPLPARATATAPWPPPPGPRRGGPAAGGPSRYAPTRRPGRPLSNRAPRGRADARRRS